MKDAGLRVVYIWPNINWTCVNNIMSEFDSWKTDSCELNWTIHVHPWSLADLPGGAVLAVAHIACSFPCSIDHFNNYYCFLYSISPTPTTDAKLTSHKQSVQELVGGFNIHKNYNLKEQRWGYQYLTYFLLLPSTIFVNASKYYLVELIEFF